MADVVIIEAIAALLLFDSNLHARTVRASVSYLTVGFGVSLLLTYSS